jgi:hypothetical protein
MFVYLWNRRPPVQRNASLGAALAAVAPCLPPTIAKPLGAIAQTLARLIVAPW